jgi:hypothetical protein
MANVAFSTLFQDVQTYVRGVPQPTILNAMRLAAVEFCRRSEAYKYRPAVIPVTANTANYTPTLPTDTEIHGYASVLYNGKPLDFLDWDTVTARDPAFPSVTGTPGNFTYLTPDTVYMVPVPSVAPTTGLQLSLILRPTISASGLDSVLMNRYKEPIVHGTIRRLCIMDKQIWTDLAKAKIHGALFNAGISDANSEARTNFGATQDHVQIRKFR